MQTKAIDLNITRMEKERRNCKKCNADKGNRLEYYKNGEGKKKLLENIEKFVAGLPMIINFDDWLRKQGHR